MLKDIISALIGLIGIALLAYGAWLFSPPLGYITLGAFLIIWSLLMARSNAYAEYQKTKGKK
tara:strand:- start:1395 stop:1580 length:186 start_codon:yes stop_codon:yes gene_type:complete